MRFDKLSYARNFDGQHLTALVSVPVRFDKLSYLRPHHQQHELCLVSVPVRFDKLSYLTITTETTANAA